MKTFEELVQELILDFNSKLSKESSEKFPIDITYDTDINLEKRNKFIEDKVATLVFDFTSLVMEHTDVISNPVEYSNQLMQKLSEAFSYNIEYGIQTELELITEMSVLKSISICVDTTIDGYKEILSKELDDVKYNIYLDRDISSLQKRMYSVFVDTLESDMSFDFWLKSITKGDFSEIFVYFNENNIHLFKMTILASMIEIIKKFKGVSK